MTGWSPASGCGVAMRNALAAFVNDALRIVVVLSMVAIVVAAVDVVPYTVDRVSVLSRISGYAWVGAKLVLSGRVSA
jgi:hypothetical protein